MIYHESLASPRHVPVSRVTKRSRAFNRSKHLAGQLLQVNRQLYHEARSVLYEHKAFMFNSALSAREFLSSRSSPSGGSDSLVNAIHQIEIVELTPRHVSYLLRMASQMHNLRRLVLYETCCRPFDMLCHNLFSRHGHPRIEYGRLMQLVRLGKCRYEHPGKPHYEVVDVPEAARVALLSAYKRNIQSWNQKSGRRPLPCPDEEGLLGTLMLQSNSFGPLT